MNGAERVKTVLPLLYAETCWVYVMSVAHVKELAE
jgi:hypothetical protein